MTKLKIIVLSVIVVACVVASLRVQRDSQIGFRERDALLQQQDEQLAVLTAEHQRLSNLLAHAATSPVGDHTAELAKLRGEAEALKKQTNEIARQIAARRPVPPPVQPAPPPQSHPPEYWEQLHQMAADKSSDACNFGLAFGRYVGDHQGQSPTSIDQLASYLARINPPLSGTNQFEIIYHGSLDDLEGIPIGTIAVVREQQPWTRPDGSLSRVYGMADGSGRVVGVDDNFQDWESKHVIAPKGGKSPP